MLSTTRKELASGDPSGFAVPRRTSMAGGSARRSPRIVLLGMEKVSRTPSPACWAARSVIELGTSGEGGTGSPGAPQPARKSTRAKIATRLSKRETQKLRRTLVDGSSAAEER